MIDKNSNNNIIIRSGLFKDNALMNQSNRIVGLYQFLLNGIVEETPSASMEASNQLFSQVTNGYVIIGNKYIGNGEIVIFSANSTGSGEIGILNSKGDYTVKVNSLTLNFNIKNQIDCIFRLLRGCERVLYFVDGLNPPRTFNLDKVDEFKTNNIFDKRKFNLLKNYEKFPFFDTIEIVEGGLLKPGSYNFSIQYLDKNFNPTEWIFTSNTVIIYNDSILNSFSTIRGSTGMINEFYNFGSTNKAIKLTIGNLDDNYPYYRIAIIIANSGLGEITGVEFSNNLSIKNNIFTYNGFNSLTKGTVEELSQNKINISTAKHIETIDNRLIIGNVEEFNINLCELQKYASKIRADVITKSINLNNISVKGNQKRGEINTENSVGYMPGGIYPFGIVFYARNGTTTPVFPIPGANTNSTSQMRKDNFLATTKYTQGENFYHIDETGTPITDTTSVRHHRFPYLEEVNADEISVDTIVQDGIPLKRLKLTISVSAVDLDTAPEDNFFTWVYYKDGALVSQTMTFQEFGVPTEGGAFNVEKVMLETYDDVDFSTVSDAGYRYFFGAPGDAGDSELRPSGYNYVTSKEITNERLSYDFKNKDEYKTNILGIKMSNIEKPSTDIFNGENEIVGYQIVRAERTEENKSVLDTGILTPLLYDTGTKSNGYKKFLAHGLLFPKNADVSKRFFSLTHPEHKFNKKEYKNIQKIKILGEYSHITDETKLADKIIQDVQAGSSYDPARHDKRSEDSDGWDLHVLTRYNSFTYETVTSREINVKNVFFFNAIEGKTITDFDGDKRDIFNLSADNKIVVIELEEDLILNNKIPFVAILRENLEPYANFRYLPYYTETKKPIPIETNNIDIFNGDVYVGPMTYTSTVFYDLRVPKRPTRKGPILEYIFGVVVLIAAIALNLIPGGVLASAPVTAVAISLLSASAAVVGFGISLIAAGIKTSTMLNIYSKLYELGLNETIQDDDTKSIFGPNPPDDEIQWVFDVLNGIFFTSNVNINQRHGMPVIATDFQNPIGVYNEASILDYAINKLTVLDSNHDSYRNYHGFSLAEIYEISPDYLRRNKEKPYFCLPIEYDCDSDCHELYPHRIYYSQKSFTEEINDNFSIILPNNYTDIDGSTGEITNIFTFQNSLFIHTEEGLFKLPNNIQERVTDEIVSFIGTGSLFSLPLQKIYDTDNGTSVGCKHKWGTIKTPHGIFFVSENSSAIYKLSSNGLSNIALSGLFNWFKENIAIHKDKEHFDTTGTKYEFIDNPSHPEGTGFVAVYDVKKERIIFTKRDFGYRDSAWTITFSLRHEAWQAFMSYVPYVYLSNGRDFFSCKRNENTIWKHNIIGSYRKFYGTRYPFIIDYLPSANVREDNIWKTIDIMTRAKEYNSATKSFIDKKLITFNKVIIYNDNQCSGELNLLVLDLNDPEYAVKIIADYGGGTILLNKNNVGWVIDMLKNRKNNLDIPTFNEKIVNLNDLPFIDKELNSQSIDVNLDWELLDDFKGKYLSVRLICDKDNDINITLDFPHIKTLSSTKA